MRNRHWNRTSRVLTVLGVLALLSSGVAPWAQDSPCAGEGTERSSFLSLWQSAYPNSQSLNHVINGTGRGCQMCHRDSSGSDPDNAYGWAIRQELDGGASFAAALAIVSAADSDGDGTSNLDEINAGTQQGWTDGANNTIYLQGGGQQTGQLPPAGILGYYDPLSFPTTVHNGTGLNPLILADSGGNVALSPEIGSVVEPFGATLDCSGALAPSIYGVLIQASLKATPQATKFGELLCDNPTLARFLGPHNQGSVVVGPIPLPYDLALVGRSYCVQGFCGDPAGGGYVSNALGQTIGI